jgi:hypothetical protein
MLTLSQDQGSHTPQCSEMCASSSPVLCLQDRSMHIDSKSRLNVRHNLLANLSDICHSFPEPLAPVSCFGHLWCSFLFFHQVQKHVTSHMTMTRCVWHVCYNHPSSYGTCSLPAVYTAVLSYQLLSTQLPGQLS